ncbi:ChuX/HutX family heme-like substrate-binding protein [Rubellicoccus peritrichatus]|uniref:ChuX/HutX family heme-like substrate-binding protein n=1 Tax=Rubellicoccus peritrichatus TaxID=3080537 RepID=A0AAQ3LFY6_9BACT|nr:ChuX/HutX family heme-like substrate-binding protein [Puniceicoccus sp. CR14]WOO41389.1 ChuX/HutX family heme-like substrate-binding protein [Puniceicoccus sp. CR14]
MQDQGSNEAPKKSAKAEHSATQKKGCSCGCEPEAVYVAELHQDHARILPSLSELGETICFARNQHCILGASLCMPELEGNSGYFSGGNCDTDMHLDTTQWRYAYTVHEQHQNRGTFIGLEFFDAQHRALFRTFLTPDSEKQDFQALVHSFYRRTVHVDEMAGWHRMGELTRTGKNKYGSISSNFIKRDPWSAPLASWQNHTTPNEMGFSGELPLAHTLLLDASEENQELTITTTGSFGRMALSFAPQTVEKSQVGWLYAGAESRALRLNLSAVSSYWIGACSSENSIYSYLEAVDAFGDLILRITSANADSYRYWQSLAKSMSLRPDSKQSKMRD